MEFKQLKLIDPILRALEKKGYVEPTLIQEKTIPLLLDNRDVIGIAQTGTGKTAAFVVPILQRLHEGKENVRATKPKALILAPTRELAVQISESFNDYGTFLGLKRTTVYGGVGLRPQIKDLQRGTDIIIATPGRLLDLMSQGVVDLREIEFFVLDEADRMLDMGFLRDIQKIALALPKVKQSLFFSATMSQDITRLTQKFLRDPVRMEVTPQSTPVEKIEQSVFFIDPENKIELLFDLIESQKMSCMLVFVKTKHKADKISKMLNHNRISSDAIHGNKSQIQRMRALKDFKAGKVKVLVATDIAARGIDVENISHVVNFDLPNEPENYVHRIGRTARAGTEGIAYSFCSSEERDFLNQIERITKTKTNQMEHKYHSNKAKNAVGVDAKPRPRGQGFQGRNGSRFSRGGNGSRGRSFGGGSKSGFGGGKSGGNGFGGNRGESRSGFGSSNNSGSRFNRDSSEKRFSNDSGSSNNNGRSQSVRKKFDKRFMGSGKNTKSKYGKNKGNRSRFGSKVSGSSRVRSGRTSSRR
ncbi:DEAD/DEAH box helicase [archaeon]|jgi:ATP-dependent RNA helicase RhlE|nr:DEAD/DEAH box helicase [archaeon]